MTDAPWCAARRSSHPRHCSAYPAARTGSALRLTPVRGGGCAPLGQDGQAAQARHDRQAPGPDARRPGVYNWAKRPRVGVGNRPERHGFYAISAWGQIYEDLHGSPARNVRVSCRDISLWVLSSRPGSGAAATPPSASTAPTTSRTSTATRASLPTCATSRRSGLRDPGRRLQLPPLLHPRPREDRPGRRGRRRLGLLSAGDDGLPDGATSGTSRATWPARAPTTGWTAVGASWNRQVRRHRQGALPYSDWTTMTMSTLSLRKPEYPSRRPSACAAAASNCLPSWSFGPETMAPLASSAACFAVAMAAGADHEARSLRERGLRGLRGRQGHRGRSRGALAG